MKLFTVAAVVCGVAADTTVLKLDLNAEQTKIAEKAWAQLEKDFPHHDYQSFLGELQQNLKTYVSSDAFKMVSAHGSCDKGAAPSATMVAAMDTKAVEFPGGMLKRVWGFDLSKMIFELSQKATGPANASGGMVAALASQALATGAAQIQNVVANAVTLMPPMITGQPLTCMPMVTGHNCFGAIMHPITMGDFVMADVTDSALDGYIAAFPKMYANKVGKTSDAAYKACFSSYMGMRCAALFPRCSTPQAREETFIGRLPMCFTHCIQTLVACPGMWIDDIVGSCQEVSVPPACSVAAYWNVWRAPPQYQSFEESNTFTGSCPTPLTSAGGLEAGQGADKFAAASLPIAY